jgi:glycosyltransferase involved in cell wall biosynthesis
MKILYISKSIIPSRSANSINVMKMCEAFTKNGHEVVLLAPDLKEKYEKIVDDIHDFYGVKKKFKIKKLWHPNLKGGAFFYVLSIFFYLIVNKKFDLVYGRFLHGIYVATILKNKVIYESHAPSFNGKNHRLIVFKKLIKSLYFKKLVVISEALKNIYLDKGFLNNSKIQVAHDGADEVKNFDQKVDLLGLKENLKVGYVGHLYKGKGMEVINSISNKLDEDVEIHVIGGLEKDIQFWKNKIKKKNIYFYGYISHKEVSKYINSLDVCLLPNQRIVLAHGSDLSNTILNISEFTSPLKLFEYMAHKKPIIASDLPVIREVLNERNSILVKSDDVDSWISAIKKLKNFKNRQIISSQALDDFYDYCWKNRAQLVI